MTDDKKGDETRAPEVADAAPGVMDPVRRHEEIALRAYYRYCERGCVAGGDVDDWLAAERELPIESADAGALAPGGPAEQPRARGQGAGARRSMDEGA